MLKMLTFFGVGLGLLALVQPASADRWDLLADEGLGNFVRADGRPVESSKWELHDGVLHLTGGGGGDIFFREWVGDFSLEFEWKIAENGNSGVKYRVMKYGGNWLGCEYQLFDDRQSPPPKHATAALYDVQEPAGTAVVNPVGEWNFSKIVVAGNRIEHWLNGSLVVETHSGSWEWLGRVKKSKFNAHPGWGQNQMGRIMLQDHGNPVWFRNLQLTRASSPSRVTNVTFEPLHSEQNMSGGMVDGTPSVLGFSEVPGMQCGDHVIESWPEWRLFRGSRWGRWR